MLPSTHGRARLLAALTGQAGPGGRPVWLMRQAGRFLPEYRELRSKVSFLELVHDPALCTEAALQPLRRFDLDATIVFSDILVIPEALDLGLKFVVGDGPSFDRPVRTEADVAALPWSALTSRLGYVYEAVAQLRAAASGHAVFGFAGAPWTLFCYMVEGEGGDFAHALQFAERYPEVTRRLLESLADAVADHLIAQARAGADAVQLFDTWAGRLDRAAYLELVAPGLRRIGARLEDEAIPGVLFLRGAGDRIADLGGAGFPCVSVDATTDLGAVRRTLPGISTQGNVDPTVLFEGTERIEAAVRAVYESTGGADNHIYNLGHGLLPTTPPAAVGDFVQAVRSLS